jgi:hypothetical protein
MFLSSTTLPILLYFWKSNTINWTWNKRFAVGIMIIRTSVQRAIFLSANKSHSQLLKHTVGTKTALKNTAPNNFRFRIFKKLIVRYRRTVQRTNKGLYQILSHKVTIVSNPTWTHQEKILHQWRYKEWIASLILGMTLFHWRRKMTIQKSI